MSKPTAADRLEQIREEISEGMLTPPFISKMEVVLSLLDALEAELEQMKAERDAAKKRIDRAMEWLDNGEPLAAVYSVLQGSDKE